jgi:hypothetical protein
VFVFVLENGRHEWLFFVALWVHNGQSDATDDGREDRDANKTDWDWFGPVQSVASIRWSNRLRIVVDSLNSTRRPSRLATYLSLIVEFGESAFVTAWSI